MSIRYECYSCHEVFSAQSRIDGFSQGYKEGILCPHCGKNIKDNVVATNALAPVTFIVMCSRS